MPRPDHLSRRRLNRATLARQLLLQRSEMTPVQAVEHLVGLQAQAPLAPYVALWSRLQQFDPLVVATAISDRRLIRTHAMRATVHLFTRTDGIGLRALTSPMLASRFGSTGISRQLPGIDPSEVCRAARALATAAPLTRLELGRGLGQEFPGVPEDALAYTATYLEPMVQVPPRGLWGQSARARWQTFRGWLGVDADAPALIEDVLRRYLGAFGPASVPDMRVWSGLPGLREVVDRLGPRLRAFHDEDSRELFDVVDAPRPDPDVPAPVRFLPEYDNVLLSHGDRRRVIPDGRPVPLPPGDGARTGTVLVDGNFRATWRLTRRAEAPVLLIEATPPLTRTETDAVHEEARALLGLVQPGEPSPAIVIG